MRRKLKDIIIESKKYISEELSFEEIKWLLKDIFSLEEYQLITLKEEYFDDDEYFVLLKKAETIPVSYLLGYQDFFSYRFKVNKNVLIPRNETEELVKNTLEYIVNNKYNSINILEIGSGSGCISITLKKELEKLKIKSKIISCDISLKALEIALENAERLNADVKFVLSDCLENIKDNYFDLIISNPPYISKNEYVSPRVLANEPKIALFSDETGLEIYERIFSQSLKISSLKAFFFEISPEIIDGLEKLKNHYYKDFTSDYLKDINGLIRCAHFIKKD